MKTAEQEIRDMLERAGVPDAQGYSSGELVELANLFIEARKADGAFRAGMERAAGICWEISDNFRVTSEEAERAIRAEIEKAKP